VGPEAAREIREAPEIVQDLSGSPPW
jgi:hypothetical protein